MPALRTPTLQTPVKQLCVPRTKGWTMPLPEPAVQSSTSPCMAEGPVRPPCRPSRPGEPRPLRPGPSRSEGPVWDTSHARPCGRLGPRLWPLSVAICAEGDGCGRYLNVSLQSGSFVSVGGFLAHRGRTRHLAS